MYDKNAHLSNIDLSKYNWKSHLILYEQNKEWDRAIEFMQDVIREHPNDMDAYLLMNYLLMNLLVEENFDKSKYNNYVNLIKWYFDESYFNIGLCNH